jgi:hypothetical protein
MQYSESYPEDAWGFCVVHVNFTFLTGLMFWFLIKKLKGWRTHETFNSSLLRWVFGWTFPGSNAVLALLLTGGPIFGLVAVWTPTQVVDYICAPLCYLNHFCANVIFLFMFREDFTEGDEDASSSPRTASPSSGTNALLCRASLLGGRLGSSPKIMMVRAMACICILWLVGFFSAVLLVWSSPMELHNDDTVAGPLLSWSEGGGTPEVEDVRQESMKPPAGFNVFFQPRSVVCPRDDVFLADHEQVYRLKESSKGVEVWRPGPSNGSARSHCDVNEMTEDFTIEDIAAECNGNICWPLALVNEKPSQTAPHPVLLDCRTGRREELLQAESPAVRVARPARSKGPLVVAHQASLTEYRYSSRRSAWLPNWDITTDADDILAIDVSGEWLLVLHSNRTVVARSLTTGKLCGRWMLPPKTTVLGGGCAYDGNSSTIRFFVESEHSAQLMSASLPPSGERPC